MWALRENLTALALDPEHVQGLITAWAKSYESIPDLIVQVTRGIAGAVTHQQAAPPEGEVVDATVVEP